MYASSRLRAGSILVVFLALALLVPDATLAATHSVHVDITPAHIANSFSPLRALGAGVDAQNYGAVSEIYVAKTISQMLAAGWGPLGYRLYTELSIQPWHWNPQGSWSEPTGQGYWTSAVNSSGNIDHSFGYRLPHRGSTNDQGNNDDYSPGRRRFVDPWHAPANRVTDEEQAGLDLVFASGLTRNLPAVVAVGMLYGIPEDSVAEVAYLESRHYPIALVEMGEEPDGQYIMPEDYGGYICNGPAPFMPTIHRSGSAARSSRASHRTLRSGPIRAVILPGCVGFSTI